MNILETVYGFTELILSNFNMAWLLLIFLIMYRKKISKLFSRVEKIGYGDGYISFEVEQARKNLEDIVGSHDEAQKQLPGIGGGGQPDEMTDADITDMETLKMISNDHELIDYYDAHGDKETVTRVYRWFEKSLAEKYALDFTNRPAANERLRNEDRKLYEVFQALQRIYFITLENKSGERLWKINDILNYASLARIGLNRIWNQRV